MKNLNKSLLTLLITCSFLAVSNSEAFSFPWQNKESKDSGKVYTAYLKCIEKESDYNLGGTHSTLQTELAIVHRKLECIKILEDYLNTPGSELEKIASTAPKAANFDTTNEYFEQESFSNKEVLKHVSRALSTENDFDSRDIRNVQQAIDHLIFLRSQEQQAEATQISFEDAIEKN